MADLRAGVSRRSVLSHSGRRRPQLRHAAGKALPPAISREDCSLFLSATQETDRVCKKDLYHKVMENSCLWQGMENKLSLTGYISLFSSFIGELLTCWLLYKERWVIRARPLIPDSPTAGANFFTCQYKFDEVGSMGTSICTCVHRRSDTKHKKQRFTVSSVALLAFLIASQTDQMNLPRDPSSTSKIFLTQTTAY